ARFGPQGQRGEGQQAGAGADVGDVGELPPVPLEAVESLETARSGRVLAGAERQAGVDLECDAAARIRPAVGRRVQEKEAGPDRLQPRLAHRHPIVLAELLELGLAAAEAGERFQYFGRRLLVEI